MTRDLKCRARLRGEPPQGFFDAAGGTARSLAIAKGIGAISYYLGDRKLDGALQRFADHVKKAEHPSTVPIAFGLAGGTGSGMAIETPNKSRCLSL